MGWVLLWRLGATLSHVRQRLSQMIANLGDAHARSSRELERKEDQGYTMEKLGRKQGGVVTSARALVLTVHFLF